MALGKKTGGRRKGVPNRRSSETRKAVAKVRERIIEVLPEIANTEPFEGDAHAFLMSVYKDQSNSTVLRMDAAAKAIRYEKPALQATAIAVAATINMVNEILSELDGRSRGIPALENFAGRPRMAS